MRVQDLCITTNRDPVDSQETMGVNALQPELGSSEFPSSSATGAGSPPHLRRKRSVRFSLSSPEEFIIPSRRNAEKIPLAVEMEHVRRARQAAKDYLQKPANHQMARQQRPVQPVVHRRALLDQLSKVSVLSSPLASMKHGPPSHSKVDARGYPGNHPTVQQRTSQPVVHRGALIGQLCIETTPTELSSPLASMDSLKQCPPQSQDDPKHYLPKPGNHPTLQQRPVQPGVHKGAIIDQFCVEKVSELSSPLSSMDSLKKPPIHKAAILDQFCMEKVSELSGPLSSMDSLKKCPSQSQDDDAKDFVLKAGNHRMLRRRPIQPSVQRGAPLDRLSKAEASELSSSLATMDQLYNSHQMN